jgi:putative membrane protein
MVIAAIGGDSRGSPPATARSIVSRVDLSGDERRTWLANERTWLAWMRTGLACTAVAFAIGRVVPDLSGAHDRWPYDVLGVGYAVLGVGIVLYGFMRRREVDRAIRGERHASPHPLAMTLFAAFTAVLAVFSAVVLATT